jgi:serine/threonine protein kinase
MSQDSRVGTEIAGYRIESVIGRGGMSVVYLATQAFPSRKVALKLLAPEIADQEGFRERFIRESNAAASIDHPNVIPIYGAGDADGVLWIAMRYVDGEDLGRLIEREGALLPDRVVRVVGQVADALDAAHEVGLVHRDVKPGNVLIARGDHAYLTDFGLIKRHEAGTEFTKTGQFLGSVAYAAPEQIRGEPVDARTDVYSLGCVLYECLTGEPPFSREAEVGTLYAHLNDPPPKPTGVRPDLPRAIDAVVAKAMAKEPAQRFATAGELAAAAREALPGVTPLPPARPTLPGRSRRKRSPAALVAGTAMLVAGLVLGLIAFLAGGHGSGEPSTGASRTGVATSPGASASGSAPGGVLSDFRGVGSIDPRTGRLTQSGPLVLSSGGPGRVQLLAAEGGIWIGTLSGGVDALELDPKDLHVTKRIHMSNVGGSHVWLAAGDTSLWVVAEHQPVSNGPDSLYRIDPATGRVVAEVVIGDNVQGVGFGPGGTWVVTGDGTLSQVRPGGRSVSRTYHVSDDASGIAVGGGVVWVASNVRSAVYRFDPSTHRSRTVSLPGAVTGIAADTSGLWVLDGAAGTVTRIDPETLLADDPIRVGADPTDIAVGAGSVWVADPSEGAVYRIDPASHTATRLPIATDPGPRRVSVGLGRVWVFME